MRILITGGAGFQGSHLAEKWAGDGHEVTILNTYSAEADNNIAELSHNVVVVWGSVTDREIVEKTVRGQDVVAHLAASINVDESLVRPISYLDVNVGGTVNVLEAIRATGARLIYASSCEVYGHALTSPVAEHAELRPYSPYAASKAAADRMCFAYCHSFGIDATIVRPSNVYGNRQKSGRSGAVVARFARLAMASEDLTVYGSGEQRREYINVQDLVSAYDLILHRTDLTGLSLNVGTGDTPSIMEIARFVSRNFGVSVRNGPARPGEVPGFELDSSLIKGFGFQAKIGFWDGMAEYLASLEQPLVGSEH